MSTRAHWGSMTCLPRRIVDLLGGTRRHDLGRGKRELRKSESLGLKLDYEISYT